MTSSQAFHWKIRPLRNQSAAVVQERKASFQFSQEGYTKLEIPEHNMVVYVPVPHTALPVAAGAASDGLDGCPNGEAVCQRPLDGNADRPTMGTALVPLVVIDRSKAS